MPRSGRHVGNSAARPCRSRRIRRRPERCRTSSTPKTATTPRSQRKRSIDYGTKFPKAAAKITDDLDVLLEFYNYPGL
jgi:hypothetical protein